VCVRTWAEAQQVCERMCRRGTERTLSRLVVGLCMHESNQPRPGVAPGDPQHEAEGWTSSSGAESMRSDAATRASDFVRQSQDTVEMTYSRLALNKRGLLTTAASTKSQ
jgi:hypothetical protein